MKVRVGVEKFLKRKLIMFVVINNNNNRLGLYFVCLKNFFFNNWFLMRFVKVEVYDRLIKIIKKNGFFL